MVRTREQADWYERGLAMARMANPQKDGAALASDAAAIIVELAARRFPYAEFAVVAVREVLHLTVGLITGERSAPYATSSRDARVLGACAAAGAAVDIVYALEAEDRYREHTALDGACPYRTGRLRFEAPPGTTDHYRPRALDVACRIHGTPAGVPCPSEHRRERS